MCLVCIGPHQHNLLYHGTLWPGRAPICRSQVTRKGGCLDFTSTTPLPKVVAASWGSVSGILILGKLIRDVAPSRDCQMGLCRGLVMPQTSLTSATTSSPVSQTRLAQSYISLELAISTPLAFCQLTFSAVLGSVFASRWRIV